MDTAKTKLPPTDDVEAVVTSFNQGNMIIEAVSSLCAQTTPPSRIIIVDDGSTDCDSVSILNNIEADPRISVPINVIRQENAGVSAARNTGIRHSQAPLVLILDGDDRLDPSYIEHVSGLLRKEPLMTAASSWMKTFGVLQAVIQPSGGDITRFLSRNCCPATHIFRRSAWEQCGGYDESMRSGFEDWDFFLSILEAVTDTHIGIVEKPLIHYRTAPASSNVKSMSKRLELMRYIIEKHNNSYHDHLTDALLGIEEISVRRLYGWENEIVHAMAAKKDLSKASSEFIKNPSYGDGGMASAVRIASAQDT